MEVHYFIWFKSASECTESCQESCSSCFDLLFVRFVASRGCLCALEFSSILDVNMNAWSRKCVSVTRIKWTKSKCFDQSKSQSQKQLSLTRWPKAVIENGVLCLTTLIVRLEIRWIEWNLTFQGNDISFIRFIFQLVPILKPSLIVSISLIIESLTGCLPLFDKQIVDPNFDVQRVVAVARFVNSSHLAASHDSYYLKWLQSKYRISKIVSMKTCDIH